jgi:hypothetical protein
VTASETNTGSRSCRLLVSARKVAGVMALFMALGPPIGSGVFVSGGLLISLAQPNVAVFPTILFVPFLVIIAAPFGYLYGLPAAALAGSMVGAAQMKFGQLPWAIVLLIGAGVGACDSIMHPALERLVRRTATKLEVPTLMDAAILCITCTVATFVCWRVVRNWYTEQLLSK